MSNDHRLVGNAAENFDRFVRIFMGSFVGPILQRANLEEGKSVLDIGCGTGFFTREARKQVGPTGTTTGLDPDRTMLEVARALSANDDLPIEWCEAFVGDMPFDDLKFDAVISTQTIMFFPDLDKGIKEICGVMAPKGRVTVSFFASAERSPYMAAIKNRVGKILPRASDLYQHATRLGAEEVAAIFRKSGLQEIRAETLELETSLPPINEFLPLHIAAQPIASEFAALDQSVQETLYADVSNDLAAFVQPDRNLLVPLTLRLVSGSKIARPTICQQGSGG